MPIPTTFIPLRKGGRMWYFALLKYDKRTKKLNPLPKANFGLPRIATRFSQWRKTYPPPKPIVLREGAFKSQTYPNNPKYTQTPRNQIHYKSTQAQTHTNPNPIQSTSKTKPTNPPKNTTPNHPFKPPKIRRFFFFGFFLQNFVIFFFHLRII